MTAIATAAKKTQILGGWFWPVVGGYGTGRIKKEVLAADIKTGFYPPMNPGVTRYSGFPE